MDTGFSNVITYLDDENLRKKAMSIALNSKCIFLHGITDFLNAEIINYIRNGGEHYLEEIKNVVDDDINIEICKKIIKLKRNSRIKTFLKKHFPKIFYFLKKSKNILFGKKQ